MPTDEAYIAPLKNKKDLRRYLFSGWAGDGAQAKLDTYVRCLKKHSSCGPDSLYKPEYSRLILWYLPWLSDKFGLSISLNDQVKLAEHAVFGNSTSLADAFRQVLTAWNRKDYEELVQHANVVKILFLNRTSETPHTRGQVLLNLIKYKFYDLAIEFLSEKRDIELSYFVKDTAKKEEGQPDKEAGFSALHFAVAHGQLELVKSLCQRGSPQIADQRGRTPLQMAITAKKTKVVNAILTESPRLTATDADAALCYLLEQRCYGEALHGLYQHDDYLRFDDTSCNALKLAAEHEQTLLVFHLARLGAPKATSLPLSAEMQEQYDDGQKKSCHGFGQYFYAATIGKTEQGTVAQEVAAIKDAATAQLFIKKFSQLSREKQRQLVPDSVIFLKNPTLIEAALASGPFLESIFFANDALFDKAGFVALINHVVDAKHYAAVFLLLTKWDFISRQATALPKSDSDLGQRLLTLVEQYLEKNQVTFSKQLYVNYFAMVMQYKPAMVVACMTEIQKKLTSEQLEAAIDAILTSPLPVIYQSLAQLAPAVAQAIIQLQSTALAQRFLLRAKLAESLLTNEHDDLVLLAGNYYDRRTSSATKRRERQFKVTVVELPKIGEAGKDAVTAVEKNSRDNFAKTVQSLKEPSSVERHIPEIEEELKKDKGKSPAVLTPREVKWLEQRLQEPLYLQHGTPSINKVKEARALLSSTERESRYRKETKKYGTGNDDSVFFAPKFGNENVVPPYLQESPIIELNLTALLARDPDEAAMWFTTDTPYCYKYDTMLPSLEIADIDIKVVYQKRQHPIFSPDSGKTLESSVGAASDKTHDYYEKRVQYYDKREDRIWEETFERGDEFIVGADIIKYRYLRALKQLRIISGLLRQRRDYESNLDPYERMLADPNDPLNAEVMAALTRVRGCEFNKVAEQRIDIPEVQIISPATQSKYGTDRTVTWGDGKKLTLRGKLVKAAGLKSLKRLQQRLRENPNVNWTPGTNPNTSPILAVVASRDVEKVKFLLEFPHQDQSALVRHPVNVNAHTFGDPVWYPLEIAVANGDLGIVKLLIEYGADVKKQGGLTLVKTAIENKYYEIALALLKADTYFADINATIDEAVLIDLFAVEQSLEIFEELMNKYPNASISGPKIKSKLVELVQQQRADTIAIMLRECLAKGHLTEQNCDDALMQAIEILINCKGPSKTSQAIKVVQAIFNNGKLSQSNQTKALLNLIANKYYALAIALIQNKKCSFDFNAVLDPRGKKSTGLHYAVRYDQTGLAAMLCQKGVKQLPDGSGQTPMQLAVAQKNTALVKVMLENTPANQLDADSFSCARRHLLDYQDQEALTKYDKKYSQLLAQDKVATASLIKELEAATTKKSSKWSLLFFKSNKDKRERLGSLLGRVEKADGSTDFKDIIADWGKTKNNYAAVCRSRTRIGLFSSGKVTSKDLLHNLEKTYGNCTPIKSSS